jgi:xanthine dehydrogenase small subunit
MRANITFFLNGVEQIVSDARPDTTLLNWLRLEKGLSGTKEGCAEGDCGACTVVVTELNGQSNPASGAMPVKARAVNACILFLPMLDGLSVTTVEGLAGPDGALHPVQEAIIAHHGAQCGFCTPGFVMSLYAGFLNGLDGSEEQVNQLCAGNLCRCTGYSPLVKAALSLASQMPPAWASAQREAEINDLTLAAASRDANDNLGIEGGDQAFYAPTSLRELEHLSRAYPDATYLAGATDIGLWVTKQHRQIDRFISLGRIRKAHGIIINPIPIKIKRRSHRHHRASNMPCPIKIKGTLGVRLWQIKPLGRCVIIRGKDAFSGNRQC